MSDVGVASSVTVSLVSRALDAATLRHAAYARNVANANVPDYQPVQVSFEDQLSLVRRDLLARTGNANAERTLAEIQPRLEPGAPASNDPDEKVRLDAEVSKMMQNAVWYQSLLTALNKSNGILRLAIREGRN